MHISVSSHLPMYQAERNFPLPALTLIHNYVVFKPSPISKKLVSHQGSIYLIAQFQYTHIAESKLLTHTLVRNDLIKQNTVHVYNFCCFQSLRLNSIRKFHGTSSPTPYSGVVSYIGVTVRFFFLHLTFHTVILPNFQLNFNCTH